MSVPEEKKAEVEVREYVFLLGPPYLQEGDWTRAPHTGVGEEDVSVWPCSVSILEKITAFFRFFALTF